MLSVFAPKLCMHWELTRHPLSEKYGLTLIVFAAGQVNIGVSGQNKGMKTALSGERSRLRHQNLTTFRVQHDTYSY